MAYAASFDLTVTPQPAVTYAPQGIKVYASVKNLEGVDTPYILETTVGANGTFSFTVPADVDGAQVSIYGDNFKKVVTEWKDGAVDTEKVTKNYPFTGATAGEASAKPNVTYFVSMQYTQGAEIK